MIVSESLMILFCIGIASMVTAVLIPCWIKVCAKWNLYEPSDDRKRHRSNIPTMGGISIFAGIFVSTLYVVPESQIYHFNILYGSMFILFLTGFFDDLIDLSPLKKVVLQLLASSLVIAAGFRIENAFGFLGFSELPLVVSYLATVFFLSLLRTL
ncbi:MAG: hypothetical protein IPK10_18960 [Bacteroidetes bacterium]|nr:hypothetical protein [Bacteroidota bacterium]